MALGDDIRVNRDKQRELMEQIATIARETAQAWARGYTDQAKQWLQDYTDEMKRVVIAYIDEQITQAMTQAQQYVNNRIKTLATDRIDSLILHNNLRP